MTQGLRIAYTPRSLTETSDDGGVLFVNVPPGEYVMTAYKPGVEFRQVKMKCRSGWLVRRHGDFRHWNKPHKEPARCAQGGSMRLRWL